MNFSNIVTSVYRGTIIPVLYSSLIILVISVFKLIMVDKDWVLLGNWAILKIVVYSVLGLFSSGITFFLIYLLLRSKHSILKKEELQIESLNHQNNSIADNKIKMQLNVINTCLFILTTNIVLFCIIEVKIDTPSVIIIVATSLFLLMLFILVLHNRVYIKIHNRYLYVMSRKVYIPDTVIFLTYKIDYKIIKIRYYELHTPERYIRWRELDHTPISYSFFYSLSSRYDYESARNNIIHEICLKSGLQLTSIQDI